MDKNTLRNYSRVVISVLVFAVMLALSAPFGQYIKGAGSTSPVLPSLSEISSAALVNADHTGFADLKKAKTAEYFYIPVTGGSVLNIVNNSTDYKFAVYGLSDDFTYKYNKKNGVNISGWVSPGASADFTLTPNDAYMVLYFARADGGNLVTSDVDLSDFTVTYKDRTENLVASLSSFAFSYNNSTLKNYNREGLSAVYAGTQYTAHAKNTFAALKNAVEVKGYNSVELDVRVTSDNVPVCYHDAVIAGTSLKISDTAYNELKAAQPDLATVDELLKYCGSKRVSVVLDVKNIRNSQAAAEGIFAMLEKYKLQNSFSFAGCPDYLLNRTPDKYKHIRRSVYKNWSDAYCGNNRVRYSVAVDNISYKSVIELLNYGHRSFEVWDCFPHTASSQITENKISVILYLLSNYGGDLHISFYDNVPHEILSEKEILKQMPKNVWDETELVVYK